MKLLKNIFLSDDDIDDRHFFRIALDEIDETILCETAANGKETIEKLSLCKSLPDIIFLDLNMPLMNGFECLHKLKNNNRLATIPVVIFTTSSNSADVQASHQLGANVFLTKPSTISALVEKLQRILYLDFKTDSGFFAQYAI